MIAAQHKNNIITTARDTKQEKITEMGRDTFQDRFETLSILRVTNVAWNSVPYGRPCDSKSFIPILCSGRWNEEPGDEEKGVFQERVCGPDSGSVVLANWFLPLKEKACELKFSKFGGLRAKIWAKIDAVEAKISKLSRKGSCELTLLLQMGPLRTTGET